MTPGVFAGLDALEVKTSGATLFARRAGAGPPVLLLHGFPETHLMWRGVAPLLARRFTVVAVDLPGYGRSSCPASAPDHTPCAKRAMALDMVELMGSLGFPRFSVVGHDRGGRVAYRLALDHPERVERLAALDVVPTAAAWEHADARFVLAFWPWALLAQDEPLPERLVAAAPDAVIEEVLGKWGTPSSVFSPAIRAAYVEALRDPVRVDAICEEYRAAATLDRQHDERDRQDRRRITCPVHVRPTRWRGSSRLPLEIHPRRVPRADHRGVDRVPPGFLLETNAWSLTGEDTHTRFAGPGRAAGLEVRRRSAPWLAATGRRRC